MSTSASDPQGASEAASVGPVESAIREKVCKTTGLTRVNS